MQDEWGCKIPLLPANVQLLLLLLLLLLLRLRERPLVCKPQAALYT